MRLIPAVHFPSRHTVGRLFKAVLLSTSLVLASCQTVKTTSGGTVGVERKRRMGVSSESVNRASAKAYADMMNKTRRAGKLNRNRQQYERVQRISRRIIAQVGVFRQDALHWDWEVNVIQDDDQVNAFCMAGGKMAVFSGLIQKIQPTDDELAARAGYDPRAAISLWQKMARIGGAGVPEFLSTHPAPENRIQRLRHDAEKVMPLYRARRNTR